MLRFIARMQRKPVESYHGRRPTEDSFHCVLIVAWRSGDFEGLIQRSFLAALLLFDTHFRQENIAWRSTGL